MDDDDDDGEELGGDGQRMVEQTVGSSFGGVLRVNSSFAGC